MEQNNHIVWAERLCSLRELSPHDVRIKLKVKGVSNEEAERVVAELIRHNFLNEERYARAFVHDKSRLQGWGPEKIRFALRAKQIPEMLIRKVLAEIDQSAQKEALRRLLQTKQKNIKADSAVKMREKLIRFALGRGYKYEDVVEAIERNVSTLPPL